MHLFIAKTKNKLNTSPYDSMNFSLIISLLNSNCYSRDLHKNILYMFCHHLTNIMLNY